MGERSLNDLPALEIAGHHVDPAGLRVRVGGADTRIEAKVMQVLVYLAEHAGRVVSRSELEAELWPGRIVTEDSVTKTIAKLRRVFDDDARHPRVIETLPKSGYRLIADVRRIEDGRQGAATGGGDAPGWRRHSRWLGAVGSTLLLLALWWFWPAERLPSVLSQPLRDEPAVAVVPLENLSDDAEQDYFADGITTDLITDLSKVKGLLVIAPGTAFAFQGSQAQPRQVSDELAVDYVIVGSVQRLGTSLRINVQIIEADVERVAWGHRYVGTIDELFELQDRLAGAVIAALEIELAPSERARLARRPSASVAAYDHYLRGLQEHGSRTEAQNLIARNQFERAIALDPAFARAYSGVALTYSREAMDGWTSTPARSLALAAEYAERAARMDPELPQARFASGQVRLFQRRYTEAIAACEHAINADPNFADAYALLAWTLNYAGRPRQARLALERAMRLNPMPPASYLEIQGEIHFSRGQLDQSATTFEQVLSVNPGYIRARLWNAATLSRAADQDRAEWEIDEILTASPNLSLERLELAFPFKDPRTRELVMAALKRAGLPAR